MVKEQPGFKFKVFDQPTPGGISDVKSARYYKIKTPFDNLKHGDITVWLDSNIEITCDLTGFVNTWMVPGVDMVAMQHGRDCIYWEAEACIERNKDSVSMIRKQMECYRSAGYPKYNGMTGTGILIRRHSAKMDVLMDYWWREVRDFSHRDQLSFNFALQSYRDHHEEPMRLRYVPYMTFRDLKEFKLHQHKK